MQAVSASDTFENDGQTFLDVNNGGGGATTVTFTDVGSISPVSATTFVPNVAGTVAAGARRRFGPFPTGRFNDPATGRVTVAFSPTTSVTAEPVRVPTAV
jgi:hypothetical protein